MVVVFDRISANDKVTMVKNLTLMVNSGMSLNEALGLLSEQVTSPTLQKILSEGSKKMEKGSSLYDVFAENRKIFGNIFLSFIKAGERSGTLEKNLQFLSEWMEKENNLRKKISSATLYPKVVLVFGFVLAMGLTTFVLPRITNIFEDMEAEVPLVTRILMDFSNFMLNNWMWVILGVILFYVTFKALMKVEGVKRRYDSMVLKIPVFGELAKDYQLATSTQLLYSLFDVGFSINDTLSVVTETVSNVHYKEAFRAVEERIIRGDNLSSALRDHPKLFPPLFISVITTGESTGSFSSSFKHLADHYQENIRDKTEKLPTVLEPILLIAIGLVVGVIALAIILPIYSITEQAQF